MMQLNDLYMITTHDNLVIVGVCCEPTRPSGYFEGWEICCYRSNGQLCSFCRNGRFEGPDVVKVEPLDADHPLQGMVDVAIRDCNEKVDRAFDRIRGKGPQ